MKDLIDRQAAVDAFQRLAYDDWNQGASTTWAIAFAEGAEIIMGLPSAQPEQKTGRWIIRDNPETGWYRVTCSECGEDVTSEIPVIGFFKDAKPIWEYCPWCGAKMEEVDE